jgi:hypothetical protein
MAPVATSTLKRLCGALPLSEASHVHRLNCITNLAAGGIQYRHQYLDMSSQVVEASDWTRAGRTCPAAMGFSFAAGTTDGVCVCVERMTARTGHVNGVGDVTSVLQQA